MLQAINLTKNFDGIEAVKSFELKLIPGKITALIGPNGAGKTTLFNLITGFLPPTGGRVYWKEQEISYRPPYEIARLGISRTFQEVKLFRTLTVMDNLLISKRKGKHEGLWSVLCHRKEFRKLAQQHSLELLDELNLLNLSDKANALSSDLSYGQSKLVEICRATAAKPDLLLLDEPVAGLNPVMVDNINTLLKRLMKNVGVTIFLIEHNIPFVFEVADWVIVMDHGEKIAEGVPEEIRNNPRVIEAYLG
ncbi:MAG: ABC transporter ATP-binding protein [Deltaproteobacteria bacterium]|nr:ABC transporter ATP-binding protein [Deltaproteobacteria bacterium]MBM4321940.1 ABC transporter ATP-binding protein [Deltaproteobacteria bacterium]